MLSYQLTGALAEPQQRRRGGTRHLEKKQQGRAARAAQVGGQTPFLVIEAHDGHDSVWYRHITVSLKRMKDAHMPKVHTFMHCSFSAINALRQVEQADKYDGVFWIKLSASVCSGGREHH